MSAVLLSGPGPYGNRGEKAAYADAKLVNFVRPGLTLRITSVDVDNDGTVRTRFTLADPRGLPLDREGITTPGTINTSFVLAHIPANQNQYVAYTTRVQTSPITNRSATQAAADTGGAYQKVADGEYVYTFRTRLPQGYDRSATHTVAAYSSRNLTEFDLGTNYSDTTFNFVPNGSPVTKTRDVVRTATCNKCHDQLALHGGPRRSIEVCVVCHTPQTVDPDTGNTVDLVAMTHKIHMGADLPSVQAGTPYKIIGNAQSVHDFSTVRFPADARNCQACHEPGPAQANAWLNPSRVACGSCHENVNFATGEGHVNLPQVSDNQCANCHTPQGELDFDASIVGAHRIATQSPALSGVNFELVRVQDGTAGSRPMVTFRITDKNGAPIAPSEMGRIALVLSGPTSDYANFVSEDARSAQGSGGTYTYTFNQRIAADAKGSFSIGIEGYRNATLLAGTQQEMTVRDAGKNKVIHFSVDGTPAEPRRQVVSLEKCNACHSNLSAHGGNRNAIEQCVLCHNPNLTDVARRPAGEGAPESVDFRTMIHKIHSGEELATPYVVYGNGNVKHDFSEVRFPGDRRNCSTCHVNGSEQLPLKENLLSVRNPRGRLDPVPPTTAACTSCHVSTPALVHSQVNTTSLGESCAVCHGRNADFSVDRAHAR